ncbi:no significant blast hit, RV strand overlap [Histoplasma capsulatum G186AR]|uniref:Uncharacterized protein n=1 Tax=Ajellomyces capsulatus TaxID=5037 RepID=A0A8H8D695_AJECA|nr:hypothetical protein I7I52_01462 [Histoplasma capsulatum]QSS69052.1 no significant blast hit, RV strand overlap [Histoplasma capsulatum G186AR]
MVITTICISRTSPYVSGLNTTSLQRIATFLKNRLHSKGSPFTLTNSTSTCPSVMLSIIILPWRGHFLSSWVRIRMSVESAESDDVGDAGTCRS